VVTVLQEPKHEEFSAAGQVVCTVPVAEKTIVANPLEALR
jgi:hypothetical protein